MSILSTFCNVRQIIIPPLDKRIPSSSAPLNFLISSSTIIFASYIRIRYPNLSLGLRLLIFLIISLLVIRLNLSKFVRFPWQSEKGKDDEMGFYFMFDIIAGGGIFGILSSVLDFLFLAREDELDVIGAEEYRKYLEDQYPEKIQEDLNKLEKELCQGGTFERPKYYPGTKEFYIKDIASATRGLGYKKGLNQKGLTENQGGWFAIMEMEKMQKSDNSIESAKQLKQKVIRKTFKTFCLCFLMMELSQLVILTKRVVNIQTVDEINTFDDALRDSVLPKRFAKFILTGIFGISIIARIQTFSAFCYLLALFQTPSKQIQITIGRWEPLLFHKPFQSISMTEMWGKHWHGLIRRPVTVCFMRPSKQFANKLRIPQTFGRLVGVLLSFIYSGLMHEACMEAILPHIKTLKRFKNFNEKELRELGYGWGANNYASTRFFLNCGLIICFEEFWKMIGEPQLTKSIFGKEKQLIRGTPRNVFGWIWCMFWMIYFGIELVEVWCRHGMYAAAYSSFVAFFLKIVNVSY